MEPAELQKRLDALGAGYRTADLDRMNKQLVREGADVSCLKDVVLDVPAFHRTYFQVSMAQLPTWQERADFVEDNADLLQDWWHVDQLPQFVTFPSFEEGYERAERYVRSPNPFLRRWGYVLFMPTLVKDPSTYPRLEGLFHDDEAYYVVMAEAWLLSYMAIYDPPYTLDYLTRSGLSYAILGRAIQKTCDSFRVSDEWKERYKAIRAVVKR